MLVYSETIKAFLNRTREYLKEIIESELKFKATRTGLIFRRRNGLQYYIHIKLAVFEHSNTNRDNDNVYYGFDKGKVLAYFDSSCNQIVFNRLLIYSAKTSVLKDIIRHELAHLLTHLYYGPEDYAKEDYGQMASGSGPAADRRSGQSVNRDFKAHGQEFREVCRLFGWDSEIITRATTNIELENEIIQGDLESEKVIAKVKKLLALASSSNKHEAELATLRANQLLLKHNLEATAVNNSGSTSSARNICEGGAGARTESLKDREEFAYVDRVLFARRNSAKLHAIFSILRTFLVYPVFSYTNEGVFIEVTGSKTNVELAQYVTNFLDRELEFLWEKAREENPHIKGMRAKNSFMLGIGDGYKARIEGERKKEYTAIEQKALVVISNNLKEKVNLVYGRLGSCRSSGMTDHESRSLGVEAGHRLSINAGVTGNSGPILQLTR